ncbi:hypothetical protein AB0A77_18820 [Streptomyces varsoviensis]|uniref:hypothetical protein n=1 Tax=Streptomyces varsoviensis TaxID=67373 RepID=UPI00340179AC
MDTVSPQLPPACPDNFDREIRELVEATAPRLFAVVEEYVTTEGERDAHVAAWGLAYEDGSAHVASAAAGFRMAVRRPERAAQLISLRPGSVGSVVWPGFGTYAGSRVK